MSASTTIKIGDWAATPALDHLERDGQIVKLQPRAMELLIFLATHAGEVISAEELINSVWGGRSVGDGAVYRSVNQLRHALGDDAEHSRYIQTIPKRGYRLIADVEPPTPAFEPADLARGGVLEQAGTQAEAVRLILRRALPFAATAIVAAGVAAVAVWLGMQPDRPAVSRFTYTLPANHEFRRVGRAVLDLSPDGRHFVYNTEDGLYLRAMDELEARVIPGTEKDLSRPFFSPDGRTVAYWSAEANALERIPLSGGASVVIASEVNNPRGASWGTDGTILYGQVDGIYRVPAEGGRPERVIESREEEILYGPQLLPDGESVLFSVWTKAWDWGSTYIAVESLSTGERTTLVEQGSDARYMPTGHIVFSREDTLLAVGFDADTITVSSGVVSLLRGVHDNYEGNAAYAVANDGTLIYLEAEVGREPRSLVWVDREGREEPLLSGHYSYRYAQLSPDGQRLAISIDDPNNGGNGDIWIYDVAQRNLRPLTFSEGHESAQIWTPDGQRVVYQTENGIHWRAADGTGQAELLIENPTARPLFPYSFSPDGQHLVFGQFGQDYVGQGYDVFIYSMQSGATKALINDGRAQYAATISPTGEWIAYMSAEKGRNRDQVFISPFPNVGEGKWPISVDGAGVPVWGPDGKELFFLNRGSLMVTSAESDPPWSAVPEKLFSMDSYDQWYSTSDGQRFVMMKYAEDQPVSGPPRIVIVQNWFEEVRRALPTEEP